MSLTLNYRFSAPQGLKLPFFGQKLKFQSNLDTSLTFRTSSKVSRTAQDENGLLQVDPTSSTTRLLGDRGRDLQLLAKRVRGAADQLRAEPGREARPDPPDDRHAPLSGVQVLMTTRRHPNRWDGRGAPGGRRTGRAGVPGAAAPEFDGERAFAYLEQQCEFGPRPPGSDGPRRPCATGSWSVLAGATPTRSRSSDSRSAARTGPRSRSRTS